MHRPMRPVTGAPRLPYVTALVTPPTPPPTHGVCDVTFRPRTSGLPCACYRRPACCLCRCGCVRFTARTVSRCVHVALCCKRECHPPAGSHPPPQLSPCPCRAAAATGRQWWCRIVVDAELQSGLFWLCSLCRAGRDCDWVDSRSTPVDA